MESSSMLLRNNIESTREKLEDLIGKKDSLTQEQIVKVSQDLDILIKQYYHQYK